MYRLQTLAMLGGLAVLLITVGHWLFGPVAAGFFAVVVVGLQWLTYDRSHDLVLWLHRARDLPAWQAPQLRQMVASLARRADIDLPRLMVYPSQMPNAFALAGRKRRSVVAVSTALVNMMPTRQLQGVIAHEIAHLRHKDSFMSLAAGILVQLITGMSHGLALLLVLLTFTGTRWSGGLVPVLLVLAVAPTAATLLHAGLMRARERLADAGAVELTGDPQGLASALWRLQQHSQALRGWLRRFRFIYTSQDEAGSRWFHTHPPTQERVEALMSGTSIPARPAMVTASQPGMIHRVA